MIKVQKKRTRKGKNQVTELNEQHGKGKIENNTSVYSFP